MPYHQFAIAVPDRCADQLAQALGKLGSLGVIDSGGRLIAYFPDTMDRARIMRELDVFRLLLEAADSHASLAYAYELLPDTDWNESWKKNFRPIDVGERFTVLPPWEQHRGNRIPLVIDPGMAFGTGHHETTRSCLSLMETYSPQAGKERFLDLGTGTGLLAIAAVKLGFTEVVGIDTDPLAIEGSLRNLSLNNALAVQLIEGTIDDAPGQYDMIAANLIAVTLIERAGAIAARLRPAGVAVLSGILSGQDDEVAEAMGVAGLRCRERLRDGKWVSLACLR